MSFSAKRCAYCPRPSFSSQSATCCIAAAPRIIGPHPPAIGEFIPNGCSVGVEVGTYSQLGKVLAYKPEKRASTEETMRRREFIALMGASVAWPFAAMAQEPGRTYRLGCLVSSPRGSISGYVAFFDELRRHGFIEGQNLTVEYRTYAQHVDLIPQYAAELVKARVDVINASGDETVRVIQQATKTIPIVAIVGDMLGSGLASDLAGAARRQYNGRQYLRVRG
jgi:hypothetical protein